MILTVSHIQKAFIEDVVLSDATFHLEEGDKAALIGNNGTGKTTLFNILTGQLTADSGEVSRKKDSSIGYLKQHEDFSSAYDIYHEVLSVRQDVLDLEDKMHQLEEKMATAAGKELDMVFKLHEECRATYEKENGYAIQSEVIGILKGLGFSEKEFSNKIANLSGGEKTRIALCRLLLLKPDLLLLDEPTNHLDLRSVKWLEGYLKNYKGTVFVISHDRYFLDKFVTKVIHLEFRETRTYLGNYTDFVKKHEAYLLDLTRAYEKQQAEIAHQEKVIETLRSYKVEMFYKRAQSREKILDKMDVLEKPTEETDFFRLRFPVGTRTGNDVLHVENLTKRFGDRVLFSGANFDIKRGERVSLLGDNGTGKTTLFRILKGLEAPTDGFLSWGSNAVIGYYDQEHNDLNPDKTIFEEISDAYPKMTNTEIRNHLALFLFTEDDVFKKVRSLSGGEKGRVALAKLILTKCNVLLLDEPTNHLDISGKEILEKALLDFEGTVLTVSHDRYFVNRISTRILELFDRSVQSYDGDYTYFLEKSEAVHEKKLDSPIKETISRAEQERQEKKKTETERRRLKRAADEAEKEIQKLEEQIRFIEAEYQNPEIASDAEKLTALSVQKEQCEAALNAAYAIWEEKTTLLEQ